MQPRIIRLPEVIEQTQLSRSTILAKAKRGEFPKPFKLSKGINAWRRVEIERWIERVLESA